MTAIFFRNLVQGCLISFAGFIINPCCGQIGLSSYQLNLGPITYSQIATDLSGGAIHPVSNHLFAVINGTPRIHELDLDGNYVRQINLIGFEDTEGIAYLNSDLFAVVEERRGRVVFITIPPNNSGQTININYPGSAGYIQFSGTWGDNLGLEGITYDAAGDDLYVVKEKSDMKLYKIDNPLGFLGQTITPSEPFNLQTKAASYPGSFTDAAEVFFTSVGTLLMLSEEGEIAVEVHAATGNAVAGSSLSVSFLTQPEGIAMDSGSRLYVLSEPDEFARFNNPLLPVEVVRFDAVETDDGVVLSWKTRSEANSAFFQLENSGDAQTFNTIGMLKAAGTSTEEKNYSFIHQSPTEGTHYYRLKQIDLDGNHKYGEVIALKVRGNLPQVAFYPNPASDRISINGLLPKNTRIRITDLKGEIVAEVTLTNGFVDITTLRNGVYMVTFLFDHEAVFQKMIKI